MAERRGKRAARTALVLVDHGSKLEAANAVVVEAARVARARSGDRYVAVLAAHMELASPSIEEAFDEAAAAGAELVVVGLFFLGPGRHSAADVPALAKAAADRRGLGLLMTEPLGPHAVLADLVLHHADRALAAAAADS